MKRLLPLIFCAALLGGHAWAAITKAENVNGSGANPAPSVALTTAASVGNVITVQVELAGNPHGSGTPTCADVTIHDNVDTGNYTCDGYRWDSTNSIWLSVHHIVCNAAGTPTISATLTSNVFGTIVSVTRWTGWAGTPTVDSSIAIQNGGTGTSISLTPVVTNFANELLVVSTYTGSFVSVSPTGYTYLQGGGGSRTYYGIESTSATSVPFSATTSASAAWNALLVGIYDATGTSCTHKGISSGGAQAVPNGTSGSYWLKNGSLGTPNCSSVNYWQPALGNFGVN